MKQYILVLIAFVAISNASAQIFSDEVCGNDFFGMNDETDYIDNEKLLQYIDSMQHIINDKEVLYRIPVKFWVYKPRNKMGAIEDKDLKKLMVSLNYYNRLNKTGISYYLKPEIEYIHSDRLFNFGYMIEAPLQLMKRGEKGCINIFIVKTLNLNFFGKTKKRFNGTYNFFTGDIIIRAYSPETTLSHEIGHYFGLKHPHRNWKRGKLRQESVSRSRKAGGLFRRGLNCERNGDYLCDTPAEPNLTNGVSNECAYIGGKHDRWGDLYVPKTDNIMSYTQTRECREKFTDGQRAIMLKTAKKKKYAADWSVDSYHAELCEFDAYEPDNGQSMASELLFDAVQYHSFHRVYNGKKQKSSDNDTDWFYFDISDLGKTSINLKISKSTLKLSAFTAKIYDSYGEIKTLNYLPTIDDNGKKIENLSKGRYYIEIIKANPTDYLAGYKILISKN